MSRITSASALESGVATVSQVLSNDPVCDGRVAAGTIEFLGTLVSMAHLSPLNAVQIGKVRERQDLLAFLRKRRRAAEAVAAKNPEQRDRAEVIAEQIGIEIESIEQGLHEGDALVEKELTLAPSAPSAAEA